MRGTWTITLGAIEAPTADCCHSPLPELITKNILASVTSALPKSSLGMGQLPLDIVAERNSTRSRRIKQPRFN